MAIARPRGFELRDRPGDGGGRGEGGEGRGGDPVVAEVHHVRGQRFDADRDQGAGEQRRDLRSRDGPAPDRHDIGDQGSREGEQPEDAHQAQLRGCSRNTWSADPRPTSSSDAGLRASA
jgi:hypothetical protein